MTVEIKRAEEACRTGGPRPTGAASPPRPAGFMITDILSLTRRGEQAEQRPRLPAEPAGPPESPTDLTVKRSDPELGAEDSDGDLSDEGDGLKRPAPTGQCGRQRPLGHA